MSKFLEERCALIKEWQNKEKEHFKEKQKVMRRLGELLNLHNRHIAQQDEEEKDNVEHKPVESPNPRS